MASVSRVLLDILAEAGIRQIFGMPGDAVNSLVEAIRQQNVIEFVQVRHEESGAFAAAAQAKLTGRPGACVGTAGPGAIHLLNGLYDAKMDHAPVIAISGQVETELLGTDYHQEVDLYTLFKDVTVFNETVVNPAQMPELAVHAVQAAIANRAVAHLSLPVDVASQSVPDPERRHPIFGERARISPCEEDLDAAATLIDDAERISILVGVGAARAAAELIELAEFLRAPVIQTLRAKDIIVDSHPLSMGGLGLLGSRSSVKAIEGCDLLLMIGTDFPYHDFYPRGTPAIQIDIDPDRLGKRYPVEVGLLGHAELAIPALRRRLSVRKDPEFLESCQAERDRWRSSMESDETSDSTPIKPQRLARVIGELADDDAIFTCDTGAVTVWGARHLRLRERQRFTLSSSLASMAYALPAAIGARFAFPQRQVISLSGDGGLAMLMGDFLTAVKYELPIKVVVFNNAKLGLIQMEQEVQGYPEYQTHLHNPDFAAFAVACGGTGFTITDPDELEPTLKRAFSGEGPAIIDVKVHGDELTMPPKIMTRQALGYGVAKVKEFLGQGD